MRLYFILLLLVLNISFAQSWNNPHLNSQQNIRFGAFSGPPKTLDPARAYSSDETLFLAQIYEPPLQYHYLQRPFKLVPLTTTQPPTVTYLDKTGKVLADNAPAKDVAYSQYDIYIKPNIYYQPHPALAKDTQGHYLYHHLTRQQIANIHKFADFKKNGTRELTADDYVHEIKRLALPQLNSPILNLMSKHIIGLKDYAKKLQAINNSALNIDLRKYPLKGVKTLGRYHYRITIKGKYPPFLYWLAMPFFAPVPWEADAFYNQPGLKQKNISMDWYPIGTGPYYLSENNPNKQMVLSRNPNFHQEYYPTTGEPTDLAKGYLQDAGKRLPFIDKFVFSLDKETIPRWNKFLQGYYDKSGISGDSFDQAIQLGPNGKPELTPAMKKLGIQLQTTVNPALFYLGFNMHDSVVGGHSEKARKLRLAISIAIDYEEYIAIFLNGRGVPAHGPIPPAIFGFEKGQAGINHVVYFWDGKAKRKPLKVAKKLLTEAGFPGGINPKTGRPLILNYDATTSGSPDDKAHYNWLRKQFAKLGIKLNIRATLYNRFQQKVRQGGAQIFSWGWLADYPDPENFLFLFYGPNAKVKHGGENATNYQNAEYDKLFEKMRSLPNGPERQAIIKKMVALLRHDNPLVWGYHPINFTLSHQWNRPGKPHAIANNTLKYERLNPKLRSKLQKEWNQPILWPLWVLLGFIVILLLPLIITYWWRQRHPNVRRY